MSDFDFSKLGKQISDTVENAMHSKEVQDFKENIKSSIHSTIKDVTESVNDVASKANQRMQREVPPYVPPKKVYLPVTKKSKGELAGTLMTVFGGIGTAVFGVWTIFSVILILAKVSFTINGSVVAILAAAALLLCIGTTITGRKLSARVSRFKTYMKALKEKAFCDIKRLAAAAEKKEKFVIKDLKKMTARGWFLEGHLDEKKTCFMATNEAYEQYLNAEKALKKRQEEEKLRIKEEALEAKKRERERELMYSNPEALELAGIIEEGQRYISQIRKANDDIPGEEVSQKLDRLELISSKIFEYIKKKPEKLPEIRKFMNYYLPTTLKMVNAYREFDMQPIQGENITKGKAEIEEGLDAVNVAFEKLFDQLFQEDMLDISTDISVLSTMLSGDGLMGSDFSKEEV